MSTLELHQGSSPLIISLPHDGTRLAPGMAERMTASAQRVPDTDWHVAKLYAFAREMGASMLRPLYSRYVIDLNRPPDDESLYPGQNTTGLCPLVQFSNEPIYLSGAGPDASEIAQRRERYWRPYHAALTAEIERVRSEHGYALLWEAHSIRSVVPFLLDGQLPDLNLGTASGSSCAKTLQEAVEQQLAGQGRYSWIANGRFKGGYITRHYGQPEQGVHALQMELAQINYMDEERFEFLPERARHLQLLIKNCLQALISSSGRHIRPVE